MRIIHLSDIHLDNSNLKDCNIFMQALINDLNNLKKEKAIDLLFITGDLIDKGGKSFGDIASAFQNFEKVIIDPMVQIGITPNRIYFVPGNHDIDRNADSMETELRLAASLENSDRVNAFIDSGNEEEIRRILAYKSFEKDFHENEYPYLKKTITNFHSSYIININGANVGINCLNTAWRCYDSKNDKNRILLGERQITDGYEDIKACDLKIALIHHSIDWLNEFETDFIESFISSHYDLVFCGHVHKNGSAKTSNIYGEYFLSVAPQNGIRNLRNNDSRYINGYTIIDYAVDKITAMYRKYVHNGTKFVPNEDYGSLGTKVFKLDKEMPVTGNVEEEAAPSAEKVLNELRSNVIENIHLYNPYGDFPLKLTDIPPRDPNFIGREEIIKDIARRLAQKKAIAITEGLQGMGGIGKTSIIVEICNIFKENWNTSVNYPKYLNDILEPRPYFLNGFLWIKFEKEDTVSMIMEKLFRQMGIRKQNQVSMDKKLEICTQILRGKDVLVVLDSAEQNDACFNYFYDNLFNEFSVLISSRNRCSGISCNDIPIMDKEDSFILFKNYLKREVKKSEQKLIYAICEKVGYHPLAVKVLASRANVALKTLEEIIQEFDSKRLESLKSYEKSGKREKDVIACFSLSYDSLTESERQAFTAAGIFDFNFSKAQLKKILQSENSTLDEDLDRLVMFNLINKVIEENSTGVYAYYNLHPLLREFALIKSEDFGNTDLLWSRKRMLFQELLDKPQITEHELNEALSTISWCERNNNVGEYVKLISQIGSHMSRAGMWEKEISLLQRGLQKACMPGMLTSEITIRLSLVEVLCIQRKYEEMFKEKEIIKTLMNDPAAAELNTNAIYSYLIYCTELIKAEGINYEKLLSECFLAIRNIHEYGFYNLNAHYRILGVVYANFSIRDRFEYCMEGYISNMFGEEYSINDFYCLLFDFIEELSRKGEYKKALNYYEKYQSGLQKVNDISIIMDFLLLCTDLLIQIKDYKMAQVHLKKLEKLYNTYTIDMVMDSINLCKGKIDLGCGEIDRALEYFRRMDDGAVKNYWLGKAYCAMDDYISAERHLTDAYSYYEQEKNPRLLALLHTQLAELELIKNANADYNKAVKLLATAMNTKKKLAVADIEKELEIEKRILGRMGEASYYQIKSLYKDESIHVLPEFILNNLPDEIIASDGKEMVLIPEGPAFVGEGRVERKSAEDFLKKWDEAGSSELPDGLCRQIYLYPYYIDRYPVTNGEFKNFCRETGYKLPGHLADLSNSDILLDSMPVFNITVDSAKAYAEWGGKKLPMEAEWEKACRGFEGLQFPWGDTWDSTKLHNPGMGNGKQELLERMWKSTIIQFDTPENYVAALTSIKNKKLEGNIIYQRLKKVFPINKKFKYEGLLREHPGSRFDEVYYLALLANMLFLGIDAKLIYLNSIRRSRQADIQRYIAFLEEAYVTLADTLKEYSGEKIKQLYDTNSMAWRKILSYKLFYEGNVAKSVGENPENVSPFGVSDMIGNVMEMTDTKVGEDRIVKGGPYFGVGGGEIIKASDRYEWSTKTEQGESTSTLIGFRCVKPVFSADREWINGLRS